MKVKNNRIIRKLTFRSLKAGKTRNKVAVLSIALTTVLFTAVFTLGGNMLNAIQEETMRLVGTQAHGGLKGLTTQQYENFSQSPLIKDISYNIVLAFAENEALNKIPCEIRYSEDKMAKWGFSFPSAGGMPQADKELACGTAVLDALGIPHKIGASVLLEFTLGGKKYAETFSLSGWWKSSRTAPAQSIWLSRSYVDAALAEAALSETDFAGELHANVWFSNAFDIEGKMQRLIAERGYSDGEIDSGENWAYAASEIDLTMLIILAFVLSLFFISGYLIIYSIFVISVNADIRFYGLLKTIGATGRQLRRIMRGQALALSAIGIPLGLVLGYATGCLLSPVLINLANVEMATRISINPLIFVFSALFSLLTVFVGCRKPGRIAAKVSPVEALKYSGARACPKHRSKRTGAISPRSVALANITRDKKKLCIVVLSLSLSLILLNSIFSAVKSFDMNEYLKSSILTDFEVADAELFDVHQTHLDREAITETVLDAIHTLPGLVEIGNIYFREEIGFEVPKALGGRHASYLGALMKAMPEQHRTLFEQYMANGLNTVDVHIYGIDELIAERAGLDFSKMVSGVYVSYDDINEKRYSLYNTGDTIRIFDGRGTYGVFNVNGLYGREAYPHNASIRHSHLFEMDIIMSSAQFLDFFGSQQPMQTNFNVAESDRTDVEMWLSDYTEHTAPDLTFVSRETYKKDFSGVTRTYIAIGGALSFVLALIGILNFTNTMIASIFTRRREFAMMQSIGMTGRQLKSTLIFEGGGITALTAIFTMTIGIGLTGLITQLIAGQVWFFRQSVTILPSLICLPLLLVLCVAVPVICYTKLIRESIVDRLRTE